MNPERVDLDPNRVKKYSMLDSVGTVINLWTWWYEEPRKGNLWYDRPVAHSQVSEFARAAAELCLLTITPSDASTINQGAEVLANPATSELGIKIFNTLLEGLREDPDLCLSDTTREDFDTFELNNKLNLFNLAKLVANEPLR